MEEAAKAAHIAIMDKGHLIQYGTPFGLKEKFARDKLCLIPRDSALEQLQKELKGRQIPYETRAGRISIQLDSTLSAVPIVEKCQAMLVGFEVIQGNMDDVFLNASERGQGYV